MNTPGMLMSFKNDNCWILGRYIKLQKATSGHYSLPLTNKFLGAEKLPKIVLHCEALGKCSRMEKRRSNLQRPNE